MRKLWKTLISLTVVLSLCIGMGMTAFAAEEDISLEDILSLLSSLTTEDTEEEIEEEIAEGDLEEAPEGAASMAGVTYTIPDGMMDLGETDGMQMYLDISTMQVLVLNYIEAAEDEDISLTNELNQKILVAGIAGEGSDVNDYTLDTIEGHNAMKIWYSQESGSESVQGVAVVIELEKGLFVAAATSGTTDPEDLLDDFIASIRISGSAEPVSTAADTGKDTLSGPAGTTSTVEVSADAIDATAVDEVVLIDDELCTVTLKSFTVPDDDWYGFVVKIYAENKSDQDLRFSGYYASLNGYMVEPYWGETVASGHKSNSEMTFYLDDMEDNNITDVSELAFQLRVYDDEYNELEKEYFTILPFGTDAPAQPEQEFSDDAIVLVDNDILTMVVTGAPYSNDYNTYLPVYVENHSDHIISLSAYGSSAVNGYEISTILYDDIPAGKKINTYIFWSNDDLADNDIDQIEDVELDLTVSDAEDWSIDDYYKELIYFTLN